MDDKPRRGGSPAVELSVERGAIRFRVVRPGGAAEDEPEGIGGVEGPKRLAEAFDLETREMVSERLAFWVEATAA